MLVHVQLRSIAEAAMRELQFKVKEREEQLAELANKLQEHQAAYLEQHARDRAEIEALSNKLFESGAASIAGLKANLAKASAALAATGDGGEEVRVIMVAVCGMAALSRHSAVLSILKLAAWLGPAASRTLH